MSLRKSQRQKEKKISDYVYIPYGKRRNKSSQLSQTKIKEVSDTELFLQDQNNKNLNKEEEKSNSEDDKQEFPNEFITYTKFDKSQEDESTSEQVIQETPEDQSFYNDSFQDKPLKSEENIKTHKPKSRNIKQKQFVSMSKLKQQLNKKMSLVKKYEILSLRRKKKHYCHLCTSEFTEYCNLNRHLIHLHNIEPFPCQKCDNKFWKKSELNTHLQETEKCLDFYLEICEKLKIQWKQEQNNENNQQNEKEYLNPFNRNQVYKIENLNNNININNNNNNTCNNNNININNNIVNISSTVNCYPFQNNSQNLNQIQGQNLMQGGSALPFLNQSVQIKQKQLIKNEILQQSENNKQQIQQMKKQDLPEKQEKNSNQQQKQKQQNQQQQKKQQIKENSENTEQNIKNTENLNVKRKSKVINNLDNFNDCKQKFIFIRSQYELQIQADTKKYQLQNSSIPRIKKMDINSFGFNIGANIVPILPLYQSCQNQFQIRQKKLQKQKRTTKSNFWLHNTLLNQQNPLLTQNLCAQQQ